MTLNLAKEIIDNASTLKNTWRPWQEVGKGTTFSIYLGVYGDEKD
ncbi:MAG: hypothetical protein SU899_05080 [Chloroflexota bacterium]|nr:hypothetical protein [Chloroflexota bacterium]